MYEAFYGLAEKPFNLTPDPRFLFLSEKHKEAFAHLLYGIKARTGFVMVSGEIGTGKTTICRSLLNQLDPDTEVAFIFNPCLSPEELLRKINEDFGIASRAETIKELIDELNEYLLDRGSAGKNCVLVIDEAQNLVPSVLEQVRLLSNIETETQKLLQIVLIGQPELAQNLQLPELRQLNQRITARYHLKSLDANETVQYIAYRLRVAGGRKKVNFTRSAVRMVYRLSGGTPRVINAICDRALLIGYTKDTYTITAGIIRLAAKEIRGEAVRKKRSVFAGLARFLPNPSLLVTAALVLILAYYLPSLRYPYTGEEPPAAAIPRENAASLKEVPPPIHDPVPAPVEAARTPNPAPVVASLPPTASASARAPEQTKSKGSGAVVDRLDGMSPEAARNAAVAGVLRAWNKALISGYPEDDTVASLQECARANGLEVESLSPTVDELVAIGLPALAMMKAGNQAIWVAVTGTEGDSVRITTDGNETALMTKERFGEAYAGQAVVFWEDAAPDAPILKNEMSGPEVRKLQEELRARNLLGEVTGVYDEKTRRAVLKIQAQTGLRIDGIAGRQVRMVLSHRLQAASTPSFRPGSASATGAVTVSGEPGVVKSSDLSPVAPPQTPPSDDNPLPNLLLGPLDVSPEVGVPGPMSAEMVRVEELPPVRDDVLGPPKTDVPKEVTPPAAGGAPLAPHETKEDNVKGKRTG